VPPASGGWNRERGRGIEAAAAKTKGPKKAADDGDDDGAADSERNWFLKMGIKVVLESS
jgi:hypothetical protein